MSAGENLMSVMVYIPTPFRRFAGNQTYVKAESKTVGEVRDALGKSYPTLRHMIYNEADEIPGHINIYINSQEIHSLQGKNTPVSDGDEMAVIPAIAGGQVLTPEQVNRYSRHIIMPQVGPVGQRKLMETKVLIVGAGGLGGPAALYLALAGVGTIGIVDFDVVDLSNLQRQVIHSTDRVGEKKTDSAKRTINALNPDVNVVLHEEMLTEENVARLISGYDVILDGTDTFDTRYTLNDAAVVAGIPVVHASVFRFEGQLTVFDPPTGPCYRCLYPTPPPPELAPGCSVAGVLGVVPG